MTADESRTVRWLRVIAGLSAVCWLSAIVWGRGLNYDEIEFFRASDWIRQGLVPYRDFWEHHTALAWYLFAPFTRIGEGATPLLVVRFLQTLLWLPTLWMLNRDAGVSPVARWASIALLMTSHVFSLKAIEYRVDTVACLFFVLALWAIPRRPTIAGACLVLAVLANIRFLPIVAIVAILSAKRIVRIAAGALITASIYVAYLFATHSAAAAWNQVIKQNALGDQFAVQSLAQRAAVFARILGISGGVFHPGDIDIASIALYVCGLAGLVLAWKTPFRIVAIVQVVNVLAILHMKVTYLYHLEIVSLLMLPLAALAIDRMSDALKRALFIVCVAAVCLQVFLAVFRSSHVVLETQSELMRDLNTRAKGQPVFDGVGYGYDTKPAWRFWFVPLLAENLIRHGYAPPLEPSALAQHPPTAVVYTFRMYRFLSWQPALMQYLTHHYVPLQRFEWIPGLSASLEPGETAAWIVPRSGDYRVYASPILARHPWFAHPLEAASSSAPLEIQLPKFTDSVAQLECKDAAIVNGVMSLQAQSRLECRSSVAAGIILLPSNDDTLFRRLPEDASIEAGDVLPPPHR